MGYDVAVDSAGFIANAGLFAGMISFGGSTFDEFAGAVVAVFGP